MSVHFRCAPTAAEARCARPMSMALPYRDCVDPVGRASEILFHSCPQVPVPGLLRNQIRAAPLPLTPFESGLLLDGAFGEGLGFQPVVRDPRPALNRQAERALRQTRFGTDHGCKLVP